MWTQNRKGTEVADETEKWFTTKIIEVCGVVFEGQLKGRNTHRIIRRLKGNALSVILYEGDNLSIANDIWYRTIDEASNGGFAAEQRLNTLLDMLRVTGWEKNSFARWLAPKHIVARRGHLAPMAFDEAVAAQVRFDLEITESIQRN